MFNRTEKEERIFLQKILERLRYTLQKIDGTIREYISDSVAFVNGVVVSTAHMAKGLEFDHVVVPHINKENYQNAVDKSMLYIACTRAMHRLDLSFSGEISSLVDF